PRGAGRVLDAAAARSSTTGPEDEHLVALRRLTRPPRGRPRETRCEVEDEVDDDARPRGSDTELADRVRPERAAALLRERLPVAPPGLAECRQPGRTGEDDLDPLVEHLARRAEFRELVPAEGDPNEARAHRRRLDDDPLREDERGRAATH